MCLNVHRRSSTLSCLQSILYIAHDMPFSPQMDQQILGFPRAVVSEQDLQQIPSCLGLCFTKCYLQLFFAYHVFESSLSDPARDYRSESNVRRCVVWNCEHRVVRPELGTFYHQKI